MMLKKYSHKLHILHKGYYIMELKQMSRLFSHRKLQNSQNIQRHSFYRLVYTVKYMYNKYKKYVRNENIFSIKN